MSAEMSASISLARSRSSFVICCGKAAALHTARTSKITKEGRDGLVIFKCLPPRNDASLGGSTTRNKKRELQDWNSTEETAIAKQKNRFASRWFVNRNKGVYLSCVRLHGAQIDTRAGYKHLCDDSGLP